MDIFKVHAKVITKTKQKLSSSSFRSTKWYITDWGSNTIHA